MSLNHQTPQPSTHVSAQNFAVSDQNATNSKQSLNAYIYDYMLKSQMFNSAKVFVSEADVPKLFRSDALNPKKEENTSNSIPPHPQEPASELGSTDDANQHAGTNKGPELPDVILTSDSTDGFLYEWWLIFSDLYNWKADKRPNTSNHTVQQVLQMQLIRQRQDLIHYQASQAHNMNPWPNGNGNGFYQNQPNNGPDHAATMAALLNARQNSAFNHNGPPVINQRPNINLNDQNFIRSQQLQQMMFRQQPHHNRSQMNNQLMKQQFQLPSQPQGQAPQLSSPHLQSRSQFEPKPQPQPRPQPQPQPEPESQPQSQQMHTPQMRTRPSQTALRPQSMMGNQGISPSTKRQRVSETTFINTTGLDTSSSPHSITLQTNSNMSRGTTPNHGQMSPQNNVSTRLNPQQMSMNGITGSTVMANRQLYSNGNPPPQNMTGLLPNNPHFSPQMMHHDQQKFNPNIALQHHSFSEHQSPQFAIQQPALDRTMSLSSIQNMAMRQAEIAQLQAETQQRQTQIPNHNPNQIPGPGIIRPHIPPGQELINPQGQIGMPGIVYHAESDKTDSVPSLQDYQHQLGVLEKQNKKRLSIARRDGFGTNNKNGKSINPNANDTATETMNGNVPQQQRSPSGNGNRRPSAAHQNSFNEGGLVNSFSPNLSVTMPVSVNGMTHSPLSQGSPQTANQSMLSHQSRLQQQYNIVTENEFNMTNLSSQERRSMDMARWQHAQQAVQQTQQQIQQQQSQINGQTMQEHQMAMAQQIQGQTSATPSQTSQPPTPIAKNIHAAKQNKKKTVRRTRKTQIGGPRTPGNEPPTPTTPMTPHPPNNMSFSDANGSTNGHPEGNTNGNANATGNGNENSHSNGNGSDAKKEQSSNESLTVSSTVVATTTTDAGGLIPGMLEPDHTNSLLQFDMNLPIVDPSGSTDFLDANGFLMDFGGDMGGIGIGGVGEIGDIDF